MKAEKTLTKRLAPLFITLVVLALVALIAAPTIAYYLINANDAGGDYTPAEPSNPSFNLDFNNNEMKDVSIEVEDKGYPVYVRVAIIITWQQSSDAEDADVFFAQPVLDVDYTLDINTTDWEMVGDYYYFTSPVASGKTTGVLVNSCTLIPGGSDVPEGYVLSVEIIVQTVQAIGSTDNGNTPAWKDAWENEELTIWG